MEVASWHVYRLHRARYS